MYQWFGIMNQYDDYILEGPDTKGVGGPMAIVSKPGIHLFKQTCPHIGDWNETPAIRIDIEIHFVCHRNGALMFIMKSLQGIIISNLGIKNKAWLVM